MASVAADPQNLEYTVAGERSRKDRRRAEQAVLTLLHFIGDELHEGMQGTPRRVVEALEEMTAGYKMKAADLLSVQFPFTPTPAQPIVTLREIEFYSLCEHHLLPFFGSVDIGYAPVDRVVGLSKLARLVDIYSRRLQIQERLTQEIALALLENVTCDGVIVQVRARHLCVCGRGVAKRQAELVTVEAYGRFRADAEARQHFYQAVCR